jgi:hypothetical protein
LETLHAVLSAGGEHRVNALVGETVREKEFFLPKP